MMYIVIAHMEEAGEQVKGFMKSKGRLPKYVNCLCYDNLYDRNVVVKKITMPQFLYLATAHLGVNSFDGEIRNVNPPSSPLDHWVSGQILESDYRLMAENIRNYIEANGKAPNYANSSLGKIPYEMLIYIYARIYAFMGSYHMTPSHINIGFLEEDDTIEQV
ncbi:MAG: pseudomurein-binding repeat-containing protein [Methanobacteriaceae archaeon]|nr:pseudomurein-binding repeat-containing protein [Methanobacteriaceae archaeon]